MENEEFDNLTREFKPWYVNKADDLIEAELRADDEINEILGVIKEFEKGGN